MTYTAERTNTGDLVMREGHAGVLASRLTEAQASIIALALNAVADGGQLKADMPGDRTIDVGIARIGIKQCREYIGPTEGVAPREQQP